eukprot:1189559-Prorocentrum_minimum.AAC.3
MPLAAVLCLSPARPFASPYTLSTLHFIAHGFSRSLSHGTNICRNGVEIGDMNRENSAGHKVTTVAESLPHLACSSSFLRLSSRRAASRNAERSWTISAEYSSFSFVA